MNRASILIPAHEHSATLPLAVASVQTQGVDDIEILIVGDGVDDVLRATVRQLQAGDRRIRFFDLPKAPRNGELHRDKVLREANGRIVCYQCDDDLWLPGHLKAMETALEAADFVGAMQVDVNPAGGLRCYFFDLARPEFTEPWLAWRPNNLGAWASDGFGLAFAAHRLEAYLRLPEGWSTTPTGWPTDQFMWHKFARQPWCRMIFLREPVALHFPAQDRRGWTAERRAAELEHWTGIITSREGAERMYGALLADLGDRLLEQSLKDIRHSIDAADQLAAERASHLRVGAERDQVMVKQLRAMRERDSSFASIFTAPLRIIGEALKRLRGGRGA